MGNKAKGARQPAWTDASFPPFSMKWNKNVKGFWSSYDFFLFYPLDSCFDIDHDTVLCSVFSLISGSALRCAAAEQQGCWRLVLLSQSHALLGDLRCEPFVEMVLAAMRKEREGTVGLLWGWPSSPTLHLSKIRTKDKSLDNNGLMKSSSAVYCWCLTSHVDQNLDISYLTSVSAVNFDIVVKVNLIIKWLANVWFFFLMLEELKST